MFIKIFASILLIVILYIFGIFFAPNFVDNIGKTLGISFINTMIRDMKSGMDTTSETLLQVKDASEIINNARSVINNANEKLNQTTEIVQQKVEQAKKTVDSVQKAGDAIKEIKNNVSELTSISGSTETGSIDANFTKTGSTETKQ